MGHINGSLSVRLSSLMTRRLARGKLKLFDLVVNEQKDQYRSTFDKPGCCIVVYDTDTPGTGIRAYNSKNPLHVILKALENELNKSQSCCYLLGGFKEFKEQCPGLVHVPEVVVNPCPFLTLNLEEPLSAAIVSPSPGPLTEDTRNQIMGSGRHALRILSIQASEILPHLFIGSRKDAHDKELMQSFGITHILNATDNCPCVFEDAFTYIRIAVQDTWNQDLPSHFARCFEFIQNAKENGHVVMVHCNAGISRSSTITIAYIMQSQRMNLSDAYAFVKHRRDIIAPNLDFMGELMQFEKTLGLKPSPLAAGGMPSVDVEAPPTPLNLTYVLVLICGRCHFAAVAPAPGCRAEHCGLPSASVPPARCWHACDWG